MRKLRILALVITMIFVINLTGYISFAEEPLFDKVSVFFTLKDIPTLTEGTVSFSLYNENEAAPVSSASYELKRGVTGFSVDFSVPAYEIGKKFRLVLTGGAEALIFCEETGKEFTLETYSTVNEADGSQIYQTAFYMELLPFFNKEAVIMVDGVKNTSFAHYFMNGNLYVTTDLLDALRINYTISAEDNSIFLSSGDYHTMQFFMDNIYACKNGEGYNLSAPVYAIGNTPYVPLSEVAVYFACNYSVVSDTLYQTEISLTESVYAEKNEKEEFVNSRGVSSRTDYLVWVDKSDYKVNVFLGEKGNWKFVRSFDCAIGAPSSPTVEGSFEYHAYHSRWSYSSYYCGPIMRFYRGYAIHSTLIRYNGTPYDNRVGMKISHGCVRVRPEGIQWLVDYIPLYTRILVTA